MSDNLSKNIWLVGAGEMAIDYHNVLNDLKVPFSVVGRGIESAISFTEKTGLRPVSGGLSSFLSKSPEPCSHAIVAVGVEKLAETTKALLKYGIKNILVEKPAGLNKEEIESVAKLTKEKNENVFVGYNRRFYASVLKTKEIIKADGSLISFNFEFTEWSHKIGKLKIAPGVKENWFLSNSTHVVDLAFYLGGMPAKISTYVSGGLDWHPSASIFSGAGVSEKGALFSYQANWESAGRWSVEMLTKAHRLILCPMEKLQIQKRGSVKIDFDENIDYSFDKKFKPGLYRQTECFINNKYDQLLGIKQHANMLKYYNIISKNN